MQIEVHETVDQVAIAVVEHMVKALKADPSLVLGLATGGTMIPVYKALTSEVGSNLERAICFALDEYVGLSQHDPASYHSYLNKHFLRPLECPPAALNILQGDAADIYAECERYEDLIHHAGGIGIQLLGIGSNGHIGFNEPGTSFDTRTRPVRLTEQTRIANSRFFNTLSAVPTHALTMGIETIRCARRCVLVATGIAKASAVARLVDGTVGVDCPATALQDHSSLFILLDSDAAALINSVARPKQLSE